MLIQVKSSAKGPRGMRDVRPLFLRSSIAGTPDAAAHRSNEASRSDEDRLALITSKQWATL